MCGGYHPSRLLGEVRARPPGRPAGSPPFLHSLRSVAQVKLEVVPQGLQSSGTVGLHWWVENIWVSWSPIRGLLVPGGAGVGQADLVTRWADSLLEPGLLDLPLAQPGSV